MDFEKELTHIASQVRYPEAAIRPETISLTTEAIEKVNEKFGVDSDNPLEHHNAPHGIDLARRNVRLTNILYPYIAPEYRPYIYDKGMLGGGTHDIDQHLGPVKNEISSAEYGVLLIERSGGPLNTAYFKDGFSLGVMATVIERLANGKIIQPNLRTEPRHPIKFIMAFSDINGIAMEGKKRMMRDATNICFELYKQEHGRQPTLEEYFNFVITEPGFMRSRLNDGQIKGDIDFFFPDDAEAVYKHMRDAFHNNIISAYDLANRIRESRPEIESSVGLAIRGLGALDRNLLRNLVIKTVRKTSK